MNRADLWSPNLILKHRDARSAPRLRWIAAYALIATMIAGCAMQETPNQRAQRIEPMLAAAGFKMLPADSPKRQEIVTGLPPLKLHYYISKKGTPYYWFADPYECHCVYGGNEAAYQSYQKLRLQEQMVAQEERTAQMNQDAAMQMSTFDPFFPY